MSLNRKKELTEIAKSACRDLRKNSTESERIFWEAVRRKKLSGKNFTGSILSITILQVKKHFS